MKEVLFGIFVVIWLLTGLLWVISLVRPKLKIFDKLPSKFRGRKGLSKVFGGSFVGAFIGLIVFAPPLAVELKSLNLEPDQEVITSKYKVEGEVVGDYTAFTINGEDVELEGNKFSRTLDLEPGDNEVKVLLKGVDDSGEEAEVYSSSHNIYFDYEGMLYAQELEKDKQAEEELKRRLAKVPQFEVVRKSAIANGFSAIVYVEGDMEDYQLSNVAKELDKNNSDFENISALFFSEKDKSKVEGILEESEPSDLLMHVRANFEKRGDKKQLFWFPNGTEGEKLALEVL